MNAKRGRKAESKRKSAAPAAEEPQAPAETMMPAACPQCRGPVSAIREMGPKKVAGETVSAPGAEIGFMCTTESCSAYGAQQLFQRPEDDKRRTAAEAEPEEEDLSGLPDILQAAIVAFGLRRDDVLDYKVNQANKTVGKETEENVVLVTRGGRELVYPGDEAKAAKMTDAEKDGEQRAPTPRFFSGGLAPRGGGAIKA